MQLEGTVGACIGWIEGGMHGWKHKWISRNERMNDYI